jgi:hypothetical protein
VVSYELVIRVYMDTDSPVGIMTMVFSTWVLRDAEDSRTDC